PGDLRVLGTTSAGDIPAHDPALPTTGRRLAYARHLTDGAHPLTARVLANRVWMNHFGRGIVATPGDFGALGERPTHPELLDWLAANFVEFGWSMKRLHRLIMTSTAYRQGSRREAERDRLDPDNRLLGRMNVRRLQAEEVRDALLAVSGDLFPRMYGPPVPVSVDETGLAVVGLIPTDTEGKPSRERRPIGAEEYRRSLY